MYEEGTTSIPVLSKTRRSIDLVCLREYLLPTNCIAWQIDLGVAKSIPLGERAHLEFRSEFFNIFNHPQFGLPQATFGVPGFGSITQTVNTTTPVSPIGSGTPREIQFALRFAF